MTIHFGARIRAATPEDNIQYWGQRFQIIEPSHPLLADIADEQTSYSGLGGIDRDQFEVVIADERDSLDQPTRIAKVFVNGEPLGGAVDVTGRLRGALLEARNSIHSLIEGYRQGVKAQRNGKAETIQGS